MDVYSAYQDQYIGSLIAVWSDAMARTEPHTDRQELRPHVHVLKPEGDTDVFSSYYEGNPQLGEAAGPFPTVSVGNTGPNQQSAANDYASAAEKVAQVRLLTVRPGRISLGFMTRPLYVPVAAVTEVSMERVVLDVQRDQIPTEWRTKPKSTRVG